MICYGAEEKRFDGLIHCRGPSTEDYYANGTANYRLWSMDYGLWSDFLPWSVDRRPPTLMPTEQQTIVYGPWTMVYGPIFCRGLWTEDYYANGTANYRLSSMVHGLWSVNPFPVQGSSKTET